MASRHKKPEPSARPRPWYVWIPLAIPLADLVFILAGWWKHYWLVPVTLGCALAVLSLALQYRNRRGTSLMS
jgi:hypothetical protein